MQVEGNFGDGGQRTTEDNGEDGEPDTEGIFVAEKRRKDDGENGLGRFDNVSEGDGDFGEGNAGGDVANGVEQCGSEEG